MHVRIKKIIPQRQLNLFTIKIDSAYLVASENQHKAFHRIWIEETDGVYDVIKESGEKGRVLDRRSWAFEDEDAARKLFKSRIRDKTSPNQKSLRKNKQVNGVHLRLKLS